MLASDFVCGPDRVRRDDSWGEPVLYERRLDIEIRRQVFVSLGLKEGDTIDLKMMYEALEVAKARAAERPPVPLADFEVKAFGIVCHYLLKVAADQGAADGESLIVLPADPDLDLENKAWPVVGNGGGPAGWPALPPITRYYYKTKLTCCEIGMLSSSKVPKCTLDGFQWMNCAKGTLSFIYCIDEMHTNFKHFLA